VHRFTGQLSQNPQCRIFLFVSICQSCDHLSIPLNVVQVQLGCLNLRMGFQLLAASEPPIGIQLIWVLLISGTPDTRIAKQFGIFTESTMLNHVPSITQAHCYQHLNSPGANSALYIANHEGIQTLSKHVHVDISKPDIHLANSRLIPRIQPRLFLLRHEVQAPRRSSL
jgi:hypothetical protein